MSSKQLPKSKQRQAQKKYYNQRASKYDYVDLIPRENRNHLKKIKKIINLLFPSPSSSVLEMGVGSGIHAKYLLTKFPQLDYTGLDISEGMLKEARKKLSGFKKVKLVVDDGHKTKFKNKSFTNIFMSGSLHHFERPKQAFKEVYRLLKPGGKAVFMEPNCYFIKNFLSAVTNPIEKNVLLMRKSNFSKWAKQAGFKNIKIEYFIYTLPFPKFAFKFYDWLDKILNKIPLIKKFSIMIYFYGEK